MRLHSPGKNHFAEAIKACDDAKQIRIIDIECRIVWFCARDIGKWRKWRRAIFKLWMS